MALQLAPRSLSHCCQFVSRTQKRSLSSQCLRLLSPSNRISSRSQTSVIYIQKRRQSADAQAVSANPKISAIVDQISQLTLLETADLVTSLKSRLNIPEMSFAAPAATASTATAPVAAEAEEEAAPAAQEKTMFTLKLEKFDAAAKPKVIKEVKGLLGLSLVDSKKFVESAPKVMKEGVTKEEAEKIVATMKALGAEVKME